MNINERKCINRVLHTHNVYIHTKSIGILLALDAICMYILLLLSSNALLFGPSLDIFFYLSLILLAFFYMRICTFRGQIFFDNDSYLFGVQINET